MDLRLRAETEPTELYRDLPLSSHRSLTRNATSRTILKVSPHIVPRPVVQPTPALKSLLSGAQLAHYNYLKGSIQTPRKQDYFHEKTSIFNFTPSFRATYFAHSPYKLPPNDLHLPQDSTRSSPRKALTAVHIPKPSLKKIPTRTKQEQEEYRQPSLQTQLSCTTVRLSHFPSVIPRPKPRPVLCIEDGVSLHSARLRVHSVDLLDYVQRYIGFGTTHSMEPRAEVSLRSQALMELMENAMNALKPRQPYVAVFTLDGWKVEDLGLIPSNCRVLLFSKTGHFRGIREENISD